MSKKYSCKPEKLSNSFFREKKTLEITINEMKKKKVNQIRRQTFQFLVLSVCIPKCTSASKVLSFKEKNQTSTRKTQIKNL